MPIITIQFIKDVVATPEQKRELIVRMTDTFVDVLGDVVRPFVYTLIQETPMGEWGIAGVPMPDLAYLIGPQHADVVARSNSLMAAAIQQMAAAQNGSAPAAEVPPQPANSPAVTTGGAAQPETRNKVADDVWRGAANPNSAVSSAPAVNGNHRPASPEEADAVWRGAAANGNGNGSLSNHDRAIAQFGAPSDDHHAYFAQWFEELWNKKNYDIAYARVDSNMQAHGTGGQIMNSGPDAIIGMVKEWHKAMPDGKMTMHEVITEGDLSTIRMTWEGTHLGEFYGVKPSGKRIKATSIGIDRITNGMIVEGWGELDMFGMMQQMGAFPAPAAEAAPPDPEKARVERNRKIVDRFYDAVNNRRFEDFYEIVAPDFVNHGGAVGDIVGPKALIDSLNPFLTALPDWHVSEDFIVAEGDRVASRGTITGTHKGSFMGAAPTGKKVAWTGIIIYKINEEGKIVERWQDFDALGMLTQLGVIPQMA